MTDDMKSLRTLVEKPRAPIPRQDRLAAERRPMEMEVGAPTDAAIGGEPAVHGPSNGCHDLDWENAGRHRRTEHSEALRKGPDFSLPHCLS